MVKQKNMTEIFHIKVLFVKLCFLLGKNICPVTRVKNIPLTWGFNDGLISTIDSSLGLIKHSEKKKNAVRKKAERAKHKVELYAFLLSLWPILFKIQSPIVRRTHIELLDLVLVLLHCER